MHIPTSLAITLSLLWKRQAFEIYDSCATSCFDEYLVYFESQCTETVGTQKYLACVCGNTDFDFSSASCILTQCGATILNQTAAQHDYNCNLNESPPALDAQQFIAAGHTDSGDSGDSSYSSAATTASAPAATTHALSKQTTSSPSTSTIKAGGSNAQPTTNKAVQESATQTSSQPASSSLSSSSNSGSNTLSTGALVGSIVGSITGAIASFTTVYFGWKTYKMKKAEKKAKAAAEARAQAAGE